MRDMTIISRIGLFYNIKAERFPFGEEMKNARLDTIYST